MMTTSIISILLQNTPQAIGMLLLSIAFLNKEVRWKSVLLLGLLSGIIVFFVRSLQITFGIHSIIIIFMFTLGINYLYSTRFIETLISVIKSFIVLAVYELIFLNLYSYLNIFNFKIENMDKQPIRKSLLMSPVLILLLITAFLIYNYKKKAATGHSKNYSH